MLPRAPAQRGRTRTGCAGPTAPRRAAPRWRCVPARRRSPPPLRSVQAAEPVWHFLGTWNGTAAFARGRGARPGAATRGAGAARAARTGCQRALACAGNAPLGLSPRAALDRRGSAAAVGWHAAVAQAGRSFEAAPLRPRHPAHWPAHGEHARVRACAQRTPHFAEPHRGRMSYSINQPVLPACSVGAGARAIASRRPSLAFSEVWLPSAKNSAREFSICERQI